VDYLTDEQRSYGDKEPVELGADLQFGPLVQGERNNKPLIIYGSTHPKWPASQEAQDL
jgi:hypothetical protein